MDFSNRSVKYWIVEWEKMARATMKPVSFKFMADAIERFFWSNPQLRNIDEITRLDVEAYKQKLLESYRPQTVKGYLGSLNNFYRWLMDKGVVVVNPAADINQKRIARDDYDW